MNYEADLLKLFGKITLGNWKNECIHAARVYMISVYGEENLNVEMIQIFGRHGVVQYSNLYSYVLAQGICIPYSEWIYDDKFEHTSGVYTWKRTLPNG